MHGKGKTAPRFHHAHPNTLYFHYILTFSCNLRVWRRTRPVSAKASVFSRHLDIHDAEGGNAVHVRRIQPAAPWAAPLRLFARVLFQRTCDVTVLSSFVFQVKGVMFYSYSVCGETM